MTKHEAPPIRRWSVKVDGQDWELGQLAEHVYGSITLTPDERDGWVLKTERFNELDEGADVADLAEEIVDVLNGILMIKAGRTAPVSAGHVIETFEDGRRQAHVFAKGAIAVASARVSGAGVVVRADGTVEQPPKPSSWTAIVELAAEDDRVWLALELLSEAPRWQRLSNVMDILLSDDRTGGRDGVIARGVSSTVLDRFTGTVNNARHLRTEARHGRLDWKPPPKPMTLAEAADLVRRVVDAWIGLLLEQARAADGASRES